MKKAVSLVAALLLIVTTLTACGGKDITGNYKLSTVESGGVSMEADGDAAKAAGFSSDSCSIELTSSDSGKMNFRGESKELTYSVDGNTVTITIDGEAQDATLDGDKIIIEEKESGTKMIFTKK